VPEDTTGATDWRELREFEAAALTQSFVLSWDMESGMLMVDVDLFLTPEHPFFEEPRPAERVCIRPAVIDFPLCEAIESDKSQVGPDPIAVAAKLGHGAIDGVRRLADGRYEISGAFGVVLVDAERPVMRLKSP